MSHVTTQRWLGGAAPLLAALGHCVIVREHASAQEQGWPGRSADSRHAVRRAARVGDRAGDRRTRRATQVPRDLGALIIPPASERSAGAPNDRVGRLRSSRIDVAGSTTSADVESRAQRDGIANTLANRFWMRGCAGRQSLTLESVFSRWHGPQPTLRGTHHLEPPTTPPSLARSLRRRAVQPPPRRSFVLLR